MMPSFKQQIPSRHCHSCYSGCAYYYMELPSPGKGSCTGHGGSLGAISHCLLLEAVTRQLVAYLC